MAKYKMINDETHSIWYTNSEKEKDQLLKRGFHIQETAHKATATTTTKKRKAVKKDEGKSEN